MLKKRFRSGRSNRRFTRLIVFPLSLSLSVSLTLVSRGIKVQKIREARSRSSGHLGSYRFIHLELYELDERVSLLALLTRLIHSRVKGQSAIIFHVAETKGKKRKGKILLCSPRRESSSAMIFHKNVRMIKSWCGHPRSKTRRRTFELRRDNF